MSVYMYEQDQPRADRLSQYVTLNRELLSAVADLDSVGQMLRPEAIATVEEQLQHRALTGRARSPEELYEILLRLGDLSEREITERCAPGALEMLAALERDGRAVRRMFPTDPAGLPARRQSSLHQARTRSVPERLSADMCSTGVRSRSRRSAIVTAFTATSWKHPSAR